MSGATGYTEIVAYYRRRILEGALRPGDTFPTLQRVCELFGVPQATASRAYRALKLEGLALAGAGVGAMVVGPVSSNIANRVRRHESTGRALGSGETSQILQVGTVGADELVASRLEVAQGTPVHMRRRLVSHDGVPVHVSSSYYPAFVTAVTPELTELTSTGGSRELAAQRLGAGQDRVLEEVTARLATESEKSALGLTGENAIVTQVVRTVSLTDGRIVEVALKVVKGTTVLQWSTTLTAETTGEV